MSVQPMPATRRGSGLGRPLGLRGAALRGAALRFGAAFAAVARVFFGAGLVVRERVATIGSTPPVGVLLPRRGGSTEAARTHNGEARGATLQTFGIVRQAQRAFSLMRFSLLLLITALVALAFSVLTNGVRGRHGPARALCDDTVRALVAHLHPGYRPPGTADDEAGED